MHLSCKDVVIPEDARRVPKFSVHNQLEDDEVNSVTHYIYYVTIALEYTKEDEEIQIPVVVLEGRDEVEYYQLPKELWDWGMKLARLHTKYPFEANFFYIEETNSWEVERLGFYKK
ncbi:hypothetical protein [Bacillus anthracis]|uniref:Uncharacterized protein n=1 Tax=Bacillus anthracis TaxID=1392 RepID=A0A0J1HJY7_BACAN|nr:hypothetical protein [Bacillus anthracis]KLV14081.1 hypothetical protein ABW01_28890 [Bacillus anthracis]